MVALDRLDHPNIDVNKALTDSGATPAFIAAQHGHTDMVRCLAENGAKLDQATNEGATPTYIAAEQGHVDVARLLLERGVPEE